MLLDTEKRGLTVDITIHHAAATGDVVLTDRTDVLRKGKWETSFWVRGTFEVRDGKITLWDDAFSWVDFTRGSLVGLTRCCLRSAELSCQHSSPSCGTVPSTR